MNYYEIKFSINEKNKYIYPAVVAITRWKTTTYHHEDNVMIGETEEELRADGDKIIELKPEEARKKIDEFLSSHPPIKKAELNIKK